MSFREQRARYVAALVFVGVGLYATVTSAQEPTSTWRFSLGIQESNRYDRFDNGTARDDQIVDNANASIGYSKRTPRARLGLFGRIGGDTYREGEGRDRLSYGGGFSWEYQSSERLSTRLSQNVSRGLMLPTLTELGVLAPNLDTLSANTQWGLTYRTSPRTSISTTAGFNYTNLESPTPISGSQIVLSEQPVGGPFPSFAPEADGDVTNEISIPDAEDDVLQVIASEGLDFSQTTTLSATAGLALNHRLTEYTSIGFDLLGGYRTIDDRLGMREGGEGAFRLWTLKNVGRTTDVNASYSFRRSLALDPATTVQSLTGGLGFGSDGRRVSLRLSGGISFFQTEVSENRTTPTGGVSFSAALTRSTNFSAAYSRVFSQSIGFGRTLLMDYGSLDLRQEFGSRVEADVFAGASLSSDPLISDSRYEAFHIGAGVAVRIVSGLSAGTRWSSLRTERDQFGQLNQIDQKLWSLFLRYSTTWR